MPPPELGWVALRDALVILPVIDANARRAWTPRGALGATTGARGPRPQPESVQRRARVTGSATRRKRNARYPSARSGQYAAGQAGGAEALSAEPPRGMSWSPLPAL